MRDLLLVRLDGIGDALACVPALEGLRRAYPGLRVHAVGSRANAGLFDPQRVRELTYPSEAFWHELESARYDAAMIATEEVAGYAVARRSGASVRCGFWHRFEKPFKSLWQRRQLTRPVYRPAAWVKRPEHEVDALYRLAQTLGAAPPVPREPTSLRAWLAIAGQGDGATDTTEALGFQIAAKLASEGWGPGALARFIEAALAESMLSSCLLLCAVADEELALATLEQLEPAARARTSLRARTHLAEWFADIERLSALVTADSGAAHAAGMLGTPVVDIFEQARFAQASVQWRPWASASACLVKPHWRAGREAEFGRMVGAAVAGIARAQRLEAAT